MRYRSSRTSLAMASAAIVLPVPVSPANSAAMPRPRVLARRSPIRVDALALRAAGGRSRAAARVWPLGSTRSSKVPALAMRCASASRPPRAASRSAAQTAPPARRGVVASSVAARERAGPSGTGAGAIDAASTACMLGRRPRRRAASARAPGACAGIGAARRSAHAAARGIARSCGAVCRATARRRAAANQPERGRSVPGRPPTIARHAPGSVASRSSGGPAAQRSRRSPADRARPATAPAGRAAPPRPAPRRGGAAATASVPRSRHRSAGSVHAMAGDARGQRRIGPIAVGARSSDGDAGEPRSRGGDAGQVVQHAFVDAQRAPGETGAARAAPAPVAQRRVAATARPSAAAASSDSASAKLACAEAPSLRARRPARSPSSISMPAASTSSSRSNGDRPKVAAQWPARASKPPSASRRRASVGRARRPRRWCACPSRSRKRVSRCDSQCWLRSDQSAAGRRPADRRAVHAGTVICWVGVEHRRRTAAVEQHAVDAVDAQAHPVRPAGRLSGNTNTSGSAAAARGRRQASATSSASIGALLEPHLRPRRAA